MTFLTSSSTEGLAQRYAEVLAKIAEAEKAANRAPSTTELIVVTKNHPASVVLELLQLGADNFGENKDQEAAPKSAEVAQAISAALLNGFQGEAKPRWNFIGQLQSNKAKSVIRYADSVHSLDRESLLTALVKELTKSENMRENPLPVFIELNLTGQAERGGILPENLLGFAESVLNQPTLSLQGVMGVAGLDVEPAVDFERIRLASEKLCTLAPHAQMISAGMSNDYEIAIRHGATHVRVGTAITGKRVY